MPEPDRRRRRDRIARLLSYSTPLVRTCLFAGAGMGLIFGLFFSLGGPVNEAANVAVTRPPVRTGVAIAVAWTLGGAVVGTLLGLAVDWTFQGAADKKKHWWQANKSSRRKR